MDNYIRDNSNDYWLNVSTDKEPLWMLFLDRLDQYLLLNSFKDYLDVCDIDDWYNLPKGLKADRLWEVQSFLSKASYTPRHLITTCFQKSELDPSFLDNDPYYVHDAYYMILISVTVNHQAEIKKNMAKFFNEHFDLTDEQATMLLRTTNTGALAERKMNFLIHYMQKLLHLISIHDYFGLSKNVKDLEVLECKKLPIYYSGSEYFLQARLDFRLKMSECHEVDRELEGGIGLSYCLPTNIEV